MKKYLKYIVIFVILIASYLTILTITSLIPRNYIENNTKKSASTLLELGEKTNIETLLKKETLFNFTDALMINTAYSIDTKKPIESFMVARRNYIPQKTIKVYKDSNPPNQNTNEDEGAYKENVFQTQELYSTVNGDVLESYEYARYWHRIFSFFKTIINGNGL